MILDQGRRPHFSSSSCPNCLHPSLIASSFEATAFAATNIPVDTGGPMSQPAIDDIIMA
jgi:hypothetical protein